MRMSSSERSIPNQAFSSALWLVPYLLETGPISVSELAIKFNISTASIRKIVRTLPMVGVPSSGYSSPMPNDLFELDYDLFENEDIVSVSNSVAFEVVPRFSAREASAMMIGLQLLKSYGADSEVIEKLVTKLQSVSDATFVSSTVASTTDTKPNTELVNQAINQSKSLRFDYQTLDEAKSSRTVLPRSMSFQGNDVLLHGYCFLRNGDRVFNLSRVSAVEIVDTPAGSPTESGSNVDAANLKEVILEMPAASLRFLGGHALAAQLENLSSERVRVTLMLNNPATLKRAILAAGDITIVAPESLKHSSFIWAEAALTRYRH